MRNPAEVDDYLRLFWTRKVHSEIYTLTMDAFSFGVEQAQGMEHSIIWEDLYTVCFFFMRNKVNANHTYLYLTEIND